MDGHRVVFVGSAASDVTFGKNSNEQTIATFKFAQDVDPTNQGNSRVNWWMIECWSKLAQKIAHTTYNRNADEATPEDGKIQGARVMVSGWVNLRASFEDPKIIIPTIIADEIAFSCHFGPLEVIKYHLDELNLSKPE